MQRRSSSSACVGQRLPTSKRMRGVLLACVGLLTAAALLVGRSFCLDACPAVEPRRFWLRPLDVAPHTALHLAVVTCNEQRLEETLMMLKSAVTFCRRPLHAHIFTDDDLMARFRESLSVWVESISWLEFSFSIYPIQFPAGQADVWRKLFKTCACQRLFIPDLLSDIDSVIYVDTDVLFLSDPSLLWDHFAQFNSSHLAALAPESEDRGTNWYVRFARHPFYPPLGVNSGVMLMNMTRMRHFGWGELHWPLLQTYRYNITWGDQDVINIIFNRHPERLFVYGCEWNFRPDHCMYSSTCKAAEKEGVYVLHGSRSYFHLDKQPGIKAVYQAFKQYKFGAPVGGDLLKRLEAQAKDLAGLGAAEAGQCAKVFNLFLIQPKKFADLQVE